MGYRVWHCPTARCQRRPLDAGVAAAELLSPLRPTVAVAYLIIFAGLALHRYPRCRKRLLVGHDDDPETFVREDRRFYPFFPSIAGRVRRVFDREGVRFDTRTRVVPDPHGTPPFATIPVPG